MKIYIARQYDQESSRILGIFRHYEDAERLAEQQEKEILKEWEEDFGENSRFPNKVFMESDPCDKTCVVEYEVQEWFNAERLSDL